MLIVPLYASSANYREWETTQDGITYTIVEDNGTWTLLRCPAEGIWVVDSTGVDSFLAQHNLVLGEG